MHRTALFCAVFALLASCGNDLGVVHLAVTGTPGIDRYEIRVFGQALTCDVFNQAPDQYRTKAQCSSDQIDSSTQCHIEMAVVTNTGPIRMTPIPDGTRTVTILGFSLSGDGGSSPSLVAAGCADGVLIRSETTTSVSIQMQALP